MTERAAFAAVGDNCIDRFLSDGHALVGGNAVNVAVQLCLLRRNCDYFGAVGDDAAGEAVLAALSSQGVGTARVRRVADEHTARTDIETLPGGDRRFVFETFGACSEYRPSSDDLHLLREMSHVHIGWLRGAVACRQAMRGGGAVISQDLSVNATPEDLDPRGLDVAFCSAQPGQADSLATQLVAGGARLAIVTMGAAGALGRSATEFARVDAIPGTAVVDATGAGDAFIAAFLDSHAKGLILNECLLRGAMNGAAACGYRGGFPQTLLKPIVHDANGR